MNKPHHTPERALMRLALLATFGLVFNMAAMPLHADFF